MQVIKDLLRSEKAVAIGLLIVGVTVLAALGRITIDQWMEYTKWMGTVYVGGKAAQGAAQALGHGKALQAENETLKEALKKNDTGADQAVADRFYSGDTIS